MELQHLHLAKAPATQQNKQSNKLTAYFFNKNTICYSARQSTIHATVPMAKIFKSCGYFRQKQMQLSKADNQLSRQQASTFTIANL